MTRRSRGLPVPVQWACACVPNSWTPEKRTGPRPSFRACPYCLPLGKKASAFSISDFRSSFARPARASLLRFVDAVTRAAARNGLAGDGLLPAQDLLDLLDFSHLTHLL